MLFTLCLYIYIYLCFFVLCLLQERTFQQWEGSRRHQPPPPSPPPSPPPPPTPSCTASTAVSQQRFCCWPSRPSVPDEPNTVSTLVVCALYYSIVIVYCFASEIADIWHTWNTARVCDALCLLAARNRCIGCAVSYFDCPPSRRWCSSPLSYSYTHAYTRIYIYIHIYILYTLKIRFSAVYRLYI